MSVRPRLLSRTKLVAGIRCGIESRIDSMELEIRRRKPDTGFLAEDRDKIFELVTELSNLGERPLDLLEAAKRLNVIANGRRMVKKWPV